MKIYWSAFLSLSFLLLLAGCGAEQFGTTPQSNASQPDAIQTFSQNTCSSSTLINPPVDILYVVDNSMSNSWIDSSIRAAIQSTVSKISKDFDYRVIGTPLIKTTLGDQDYQVLASNPSSLPSTVPSSKRITDYSQFTFFNNEPPYPTQANPNIPMPVEAGIGRVNEFISAHASTAPASNRLLRPNANLIIVLVSNGKDNDIEHVTTGQNVALFNQSVSRFLHPTTGWKKVLNLKQLRFLSVTVKNKALCPDPTGIQNSALSYVPMSQAIYDSNNFTYQDGNGTDHYDLCSSSQISSVFEGVNASITKTVIHHKYNRWPVTFATPSTGLNYGAVQVFKSSPSSATVELPSTVWQLKTNSGSIPTRVEPTVGENTDAPFYLEFASGSEIIHPECVTVVSSSNLEYFNYVVIPKNPIANSVILKIRGQTIPQSSTNGWQLEGYAENKNTKVAYGGFSELPAAKKTGYFIKLNGSSNYYKSGDNVTIDYLPASN